MMKKDELRKGRYYKIGENECCGYAMTLYETVSYYGRCNGERKWAVDFGNGTIIGYIDYPSITYLIDLCYIDKEDVIRKNWKRTDKDDVKKEKKKISRPKRYFKVDSRKKLTTQLTELSEVIGTQRNDILSRGGGYTNLSDNARGQHDALVNVHVMLKELLIEHGIGV
jgi:hypothetical protein